MVAHSVALPTLVAPGNADLDLVGADRETSISETPSWSQPERMMSIALFIEPLSMVGC